MEDLFREILAPSPSLPTAALPTDNTSAAAIPTVYLAAAAFTPQVSSTATEGSESTGDAAELAGNMELSLGVDMDVRNVDWTSEAEMQRILDMLPEAAAVAASSGSGAGQGSGLLSDLDMGWELEGFGIGSGGIGVF